MMIPKTLATLALAGSMFASSIGVAAAHDLPDNRPRSQMEKWQDKLVADGACMAAAVDTRDTAIIVALDAYHVGVKTALVTRRSSLRAAWILTDATLRHDELKRIQVDFRGTWRNYSKDLRMARKAAWSAYDVTRKACKGQDEDQHGNRGLDMRL